MERKRRFVSLRTKIIFPLALSGLLLLLFSVAALMNGVSDMETEIIESRLQADRKAMPTVSTLFEPEWNWDIRDGIFYLSSDEYDFDIDFDAQGLAEATEYCSDVNGCFICGYVITEDGPRLLFDSSPEKTYVDLDTRVGMDPETAEAVMAGEPVYVDTKQNGKNVSWRLDKLDDKRIIGVGRDAGEFDSIARRTAILMAAAQLLLLTVCFVLLMLLVSRIMKRLRKVSDYLGAVGENELTQKELRISTNDEVGDMAETVNRMIQGLREREHMKSELDVATAIQANMLPSRFPAFPDRQDFDIFASMIPARQVGGDFYDFFFVGEDRLAFLIADVSGKGVPAALFMVLGKTLLRSFIAQEENLGAAFEKASAALNADNRKMMFITAWAGVLDLTTGELNYVNAGHCPPLLCRAGGEYGWLTERHGPVLGIMKNARYRMGRDAVRPGDKLFLYTDGVNEATNGNNELYGKQRLIEYLNGSTQTGPEETLAGVKRSVDAFVGDAPQMDDLTMLMLEKREKEGTGNDTEDTSLQK